MSEIACLVALEVVQGFLKAENLTQVTTLFEILLSCMIHDNLHFITICLSVNLSNRYTGFVSFRSFTFTICIMKDFRNISSQFLNFRNLKCQNVTF